MASGYSDLSEIRKDTSNYAAHTKPPKINLLNEKPRRESLVEQQLATSIVRRSVSPFGAQQQVEIQSSSGQQASDVRSQQLMTSTSNQWSYIDEPSQSYSFSRPVEMNYGEQPKLAIQRQQEELNWRNSYQQQGTSAGGSHYNNQHVTRTTVETNTRQTPTYADLAADLAEKEAKLKREIAYFNQHQGPWSRPRQVREPRQEPAPRVMRSDQRWVRECPSGSSSRPTSRASSTRSTTEADLMEKASKLLQDVEELERKPLNTQQILIESGARRSMDRDQKVGSLHTAIIKVPNHEPDNKSPLPFAFDNFSTQGVRGNIASVGAAEPEKPYPPIFPTIKRTPSPNKHR